jgi:hypothetical protein
MFINPEIKFYRSSGEFGFLSNLYKRQITFEGRQFPHAEAAYQFGKAKDPGVAEWIAAAPKPHLCAAIGHALLAFDIKPDWQDIKIERMRQVLYAKFTQHPDLAEELLNTFGATLIEASPTDSFWGIGKNGRGSNMLGILLMELRRKLQQQRGK